MRPLQRWQARSPWRLLPLSQHLSQHLSLAQRQAQRQVQLQVRQLAAPLAAPLAAQVALEAEAVEGGVRSASSSLWCSAVLNIQRHGMRAE